MEEPDLDKKKYVAKNYFWLIPKVIRVYNSFCRNCRALALQNPGRSMDDYCPICKGKIKNIIGELK